MSIRRDICNHFVLDRKVVSLHTSNLPNTIWWQQSKRVTPREVKQLAQNCGAEIKIQVV